MTFREWLFTKKNLKCQVGDLAHDSFRTQNDWNGDCPNTLRGHMLRHAACRDAFAALTRAERAWQRQCGGAA